MCSQNLPFATLLSIDLPGSCMFNGMPATECLMLPHGPTKVLWRVSARARRISLRIDPSEGRVVVTLPTRATMAAGRSLLAGHALWIAERLGRLPDAVAIAPGAQIPLCGNLVTIRHCRELKGSRFDGATLQVGGAPEFLKRRVADLLKSEARRHLTGLATTLATRFGLRFTRIVLKDPKSRWGSCTSGGTLMFSWRLVMAPVSVQHYVVAHELAHLRHMNHGTAFWTLVEQLTPHRAMARAWLDEHGAGLMRIG